MIDAPLALAFTAGLVASVNPSCTHATQAASVIPSSASFLVELAATQIVGP